MDAPAMVVLLSVALGGEPEPADCADWVPRFELVARVPERGFFYDYEPVKIELYLAGVCPEKIPGVERGAFAVIEECYEEDAECDPFLKGSAGVAIENLALEGCTLGIVHVVGCKSRSGVHRYAQTRVCASCLFGVPCLAGIEFSPEGRALIGTFEVASSPPRRRRLLVGDFRHTESEPGRVHCQASEAELGIRAPGRGKFSPEDSEPVEIRILPRPFIRGDAERDGDADLSDALFMLQFLFLGGYQFFPCAHAADVDDNNLHNITDAVCLLMFLFLGGPPPPAPFPEPGYDPTPRESDRDPAGCYHDVFL